ncbi:unnamed protein product [Clavelina lepadiformis]|uniref:G-protein coupled receptors family 1 profile domain-containing protein n=1 Tax=Clavelina lepadiformis TaxID=159417 RepID=A0ABP0FVU4_CLALP
MVIIEVTTQTVGNQSFSNATTYPADDFDSNKLKTASLIVTFVALAFVCYIIIAISYFGFTKKLMIGCGGSHSWEQKNRAQSVVNLMILVAAVSVLVYDGIEIPLIVPQVQPFCAVYQRIKIVSFGMTFASVYFALWFRVYTAFYSNSILKKITSRVPKIINGLTLAFLALIVVSNFVLFFTTATYATTPKGCSPVQNKENNKIKWAVLVLCTTAFQVMLLYSFIYPLRVQQQKRLARGFDPKSTMPILKRAAITAVVCVLSDILNSVFAILYKNPTVYINHIVFSCNLLINLVAVVLSAANWREKIVPCRCSIHVVPVSGRKYSSQATGSTGTRNLHINRATANSHNGQTTSVAKL